MKKLEQNIKKQIHSYQIEQDLKKLVKKQFVQMDNYHDAFIYCKENAINFNDDCFKWNGKYYIKPVRW